MREGKNPAKESIHLEAKYYHRIIVPVFIPNFEGYFKDAEKILRLCLDSILATKHSAVCISVINNGCCEEIGALLNQYFGDGRIEHLVNFQENKGKIDAIFSVAKGCYEPLITITDSDVLFLPGWVEEVENAIVKFPEIGLISPCPLPALWNYKNTATLLGGFFTFNLRLSDLLRQEDLLKFQLSVNNPDLYKGKELLLEKQLYMKRNDTAVVIGAGHFVATMRREVFMAAPDRPSLRKIVGNSERQYIDIPVDKLGLYRVGTSKVLAHHLGNTFENWMEEEFKKIMDTPHVESLLSIPLSKRHWSSWLPYFFRKYFSLLLVIRISRRVFFALTRVGFSNDFKS